MIYRVEIRNRETKDWDVQLEGEAPSRRKFIKTNAEQVDVLRRSKQQWRVVHE